VPTSLLQRSVQSDSSFISRMKFSTFFLVAILPAEKFSNLVP
jgi:hypothetical protein